MSQVKERNKILGISTSWGRCPLPGSALETISIFPKSLQTEWALLPSSSSGSYDDLPWPVLGASWDSLALGAGSVGSGLEEDFQVLGDEESLSPFT